MSDLPLRAVLSRTSPRGFGARFQPRREKRGPWLALEASADRSIFPAGKIGHLAFHGLAPPCGGEPPPRQLGWVSRTASPCRAAHHPSPCAISLHTLRFRSPPPFHQAHYTGFARFVNAFTQSVIVAAKATASRRCPTLFLPHAICGIVPAL